MSLNIVVKSIFSLSNDFFTKLIVSSIARTLACNWISFSLIAFSGLTKLVTLSAVISWALVLLKYF